MALSTLSTYLSLKMTKCIRIRNVITTCVWLSGFVFAYLVFQNGSSSPSVSVDAISISFHFCPYLVDMFHVLIHQRLEEG